MSGLSFREQAAIALRASRRDYDMARPDQPSDIKALERTEEDAVTDAQALATECCRRWGHDPKRVTVALPCKRCGFKPLGGIR